MPPKPSSNKGLSKKTELKKKEKLKTKDKKFELQNKKTVKQNKSIQQAAEISKPIQKVKKGADPKSLLCAFFKRGQCSLEDKCPLSHDMTIERKAETRSLYYDMREDEKDTMETWDVDKLKDVVKKKHNSVVEDNKTEIICKHFLTAVQSQKYGWFWECPSLVPCIYRHALPPEFQVKKDGRKKWEGDKENEFSLEDWNEEGKNSLNSINRTKVTAETWAWKKKKVAEKKEENAKAKERKLKAFRGNVPKVLSGRALFETYEMDLLEDSSFEDDENAVVKATSKGENKVTEQWLSATYAQVIGQEIGRADLFAEYKAFAESKGLKAQTNANFGKIVKSLFAVTGRRRGPRGANKYYHVNIGKKTENEEINPFMEISSVEEETVWKNQVRIGSPTEDLSKKKNYNTRQNARRSSSRSSSSSSRFCTGSPPPKMPASATARKIQTRRNMPRKRSSSRFTLSRRSPASSSHRNVGVSKRRISSVSSDFSYGLDANQIEKKKKVLVKRAERVGGVVEKRRVRMTTEGKKLNRNDGLVDKLGGGEDLNSSLEMNEEAKKLATRRSDLMKQLRAVEKEIAKKRSRI